VTDILKAMGLTKPYPEGVPAVEWGRARGKSVHQAIALFEEGEDLGPLHADVRGPYDQYLRFRETTRYVPRTFEHPVVHPRLRYRGTLDSEGVFGGGEAVLDFKCSKQPDLQAAAYQLAGYALALAAMEEAAAPGATAILRRCYVIQLGEDSYRVHEVTSSVARSVFEAAVLVWWAQREKLPMNRAEE
jgi:hypothetical protein